MNRARLKRAVAFSVLTGATTLGAAIVVPALPAAATAESGASSTVATRPVSPLATITLDSSQAPDLADWLQNRVAPALRTWYPRIQPTLGGTAPSSFTVRISSSYTGVAYTSGRTITLGARYFRSHQSDVGATVHEAVHVAQQYRGLVGWASKGSPTGSGTITTKAAYCRNHRPVPAGQPATASRRTTSSTSAPATTPTSCGRCTSPARRAARAPKR